MEEYLADKPMEEPMEDGGAAVTQEQTAPEQEQTETPQREQAEEEAAKAQKKRPPGLKIPDAKASRQFRWKKRGSFPGGCGKVRKRQETGFMRVLDG